MISKYGKKGGATSPSKAQPKQKQEAAATPKKRAERTHRFFRYRGVAFIAVRDGDKACVQTWNEETRTANPGVEVPKDKISAATKALAKIVLAEKELEEIAITKE
jgi:hypothetical protein